MKSKKKAAALAGAAAILAIGGTFAYFNQTLTVTNEFDTGTYDTELVEQFKPSEGENWEPGANVNKDVYVTNTGSLPVVVRVKFQETWDRDGDVFYDVDTTVNNDALEANETETKFMNVWQADPTDGEAGTAIDDSVVYKKLLLDNGWFYNSDDGYYYYQHVLDGYQENADGTVTYAQTPLLLDSVTLCENVDMGAFDVVKYYSTATSTPSNASPSDAETGWVEFEKKSDGTYLTTQEMNELLSASGKTINYMKSATVAKTGLLGYSDADYTLTITAQTVQATKQAVEDTFKNNEDYFNNTWGCDWDLKDENEVQS